MLPFFLPLLNDRAIRVCDDINLEWCIYVYVCKYVCVGVPCMHECKYVCLSVSVHEGLCTCMYVRIYLCVTVCTYAFMYMYVCVHCFVFIHFYCASHIMSFSEALPTTAIDTMSKFTRR